MATTAPAVAQVKSFNIPAQPAAKAIPELARQADVQILVNAAALQDVKGRSVKGAMTVEAALGQLLKGSGLRAASSDRHTYIVAADPTAKVGQAGRPIEGAADSSDRAILPGDIIVTATKRPEAVRRISGSVTAVTGDQLEKLGASSFSDYIGFAPGVVYNARTPGISSIIVRGIGTTSTIDVGQGATAYYINDVPLADPYSAVGIPDIDTFDVDNVTILKGPQGTLFGSGALGGAVNYQAAKPNLNDYQAKLQGSINGVDHGDVGGAGKVMANVPLVSGTLAVRGVFVYRRDAGFIDDLGTKVRNANATTVTGGRAEATWAPGSDTTFNYLFLDQVEQTDDGGYEQPIAFGHYNKSTLVPDFSKYKTLIHSLRLDQNLGFATLTAMASYHDKVSQTRIDQTAGFVRLIPGVSPVTSQGDATSRGETFEVRLVSNPGGPFDYLVGVMFDRTKEHFATHFSGPGAAQAIETTYAKTYGAGIGASGAPGDVFYDYSFPLTAKEAAGFGEATYHFNDQWKITLGGRYFYTYSERSTTTSGFYQLLSAGNLSSTSAVFKAHALGFTPKGSITWTPNKDFLVYALVSKGYRFGGANTNPSLPGSPIPATFGPDSLINYEFGVRADMFDSRVQFDSTAYYLDWSNIQLSLGAANGLAYVANAGKARSYGVENALTWRMAPGLSFQTNVTYLSAKLTEDFAPGSGQPVVPKGTTLPGAAKWQLGAVLSYQWRDGPLKPTLLVSNTYISGAFGELTSSAATLPIGNYDITNARLSFHLKPAMLTLFVNNIGDTYGITQATISRSVLKNYLVRPRTIGLTLDVGI